MKDFHYHQTRKIIKCKRCKVDYFPNPTTTDYHQSNKCTKWIIKNYHITKKHRYI